MKKLLLNRKRVFAFLLALCLGMGTAYAYDFYKTISGKRFYFNIIDFTQHYVEITYPGENYWEGFTKPTGSITLPSSVTYNNVTYTVKAIGDYAFYECSGLTGTLTLPNTVNTIGEEAFYGCTGFTGSLTIPDSVTTIGPLAFASCSGFNGSLTLPSSLTTIDYGAFEWCPNFTGNLTIPNSVTSMDDFAFHHSGFTGSLTIGNSVTSIGECAFSSCGFTGTLTIGNSVTTIGRSAFHACNGFTGSLVIPNSVTTIDEWAFYGCRGMTGTLTLGNSLTTIGYRAFWDNRFTGSLTIPNSVTTIGEDAFEYNSGFNGTLTIGTGVTSIGTSAFKSCSGFTQVNYNATNCADVDSEDKPFEGCGGTLTIGDNVERIPNWMFFDCPGFTGDLIIPNSVTEIGDYAFYCCTGFDGSLAIGNFVNSIGDFAFGACTSFSSLTIGSSVAEIGDYAFAWCSGLTSMTVYCETPPELGISVFDDVSTTIPVYVPCVSLEDYQTAEGWSAFDYIQCIMETLTVHDGTTAKNTIPAYIFYFDEFTRSQFIIPAEDLAEMTGTPIRSMTFYTTSLNVPYTTVSPADVYLMEVDYTEISAYEPKENATIVYSGLFDIVSAGDGGEMTINFNTPYTYQGGNLLVGIENTQNVGYKNIYFCGEAFYMASIYGSNATSLENVQPTQQHFIPKTTFSYYPSMCEPRNLPYFYGFEDVDELDCWTMLNPQNNTGWEWWASTHEGEKGFRFHCNSNQPQYLISPEFEGNGGMNVSFYYRNYTDYNFETFQVGYSTTTKSPDAFTWSDEVTADDANTWMLYEDLFPDGTKYVAVKYTSTSCGTLCLDDFSFTSPFCHDPTNLTASNITSNSADVYWTGEQDSYNVKYRMIPNGSWTEKTVMPNHFMDDFEDGLDQWTLIDADGDGRNWTYGTISGGSPHGGSKMAFSFSWYGGSALNPDNYLVTPCVTLGGTVTFWASAWDPNDFAEHFGIAVSTGSNTNPNDFTIVQEWTMTAKGGGQGGPRGNRAMGAWSQYTVDLSAYAGQTGYIAIRHFNCTDQFALAIDDFIYGDVGFTDGFESGLGRWIQIDGDSDGNNWESFSATTNASPHEGGGMVVSYSKQNNVALYPNNYLVSPQVVLGGTVTFWASAVDNAYAAEHFGIAVSTSSNTNPSDFVLVNEWTMTAKGDGRGGPHGSIHQGQWYQYTADLSAYAGQIGYIALRHFNCTDWNGIYVDDFSYDGMVISTGTTIAGLNPTTTYEVQVQGICQYGLTEWSEPVSFTTAIPTFPYGDYIGTALYDLQTNFGARTWTHVWPDGKVNFAFMTASILGYNDRGTGIGTYDSATDVWIPSMGRVENERTGFGTIAQYGANGIVVAAHTNTSNIYIIPDKDDIAAGSAVRVGSLDSTHEPYWPNVMTSGANRDIIHVIAQAQESDNNMLYYFRSRDGGQTWDRQNEILPYMGTDYCINWMANCYYWMETTEDNCLALVVNNRWSDGMVLYSYDDGDTWERKVFYKHPDPFGSFEVPFYYPRWTSCQWDSQHHLHVLYELGAVDSNYEHLDLGGVAYWNETMPYDTNGNTVSAFEGNLVPGQPFVMESAYLENDIYRSWWHYTDATHEMWPEYIGYLAPLTDDGDPEDPYQATEFNIENENLGQHGYYRSGVCSFPVLCMVPNSNEMVAVWSALDENHTDVNGNYYYKIFASYSNNRGATWSPMIQLTKDFDNAEFVYNQAAVVGRKLVIATQTDGETGTYVYFHDSDAYDCYYLGMVFDIDDLFDTSSPVQTIELSEGWNWVSTYIDLNEVNGIAMLEEALGDYGVTIALQDDYAVYVGDGLWIGLEDYELTNAEMVMVEVTEDCTITLEGPIADPSTVEITLNPGWTWFGFPVDSELELVNVFVDPEPEFGDAIAAYYGGVQFLGEWDGDFDVLLPGQGYNYWNETDEVKVLTFQTGANAHAYVDLDLPSGTLWATCNVGANAPEEYGDYFAWGETTPKDYYDWSTYQHCNGISNTLTKYCSNSSCGYNGFTDDLTTLLPEDDAATANWGSGWRMPTKEEWQELYNNTTMTWTTQNGVSGMLFTASNGNSLFLPAAGCIMDDEYQHESVVGLYWSSSLSTDYPKDAWYFYFEPGNYGMDDFHIRYFGQSVRPVRSRHN